LLHARLFLALPYVLCFVLYFLTNPPTPDIYTLSLHDALPISDPDCRSPPMPTSRRRTPCSAPWRCCRARWRSAAGRCSAPAMSRSEEHTSELQSHLNLVCRLLLEKKKNMTTYSACTKIRQIQH